MSDFNDDFDGDFGDDGFMDEEPFEDDLSGEGNCNEEPFDDDLSLEEHCQDEPDAPLTDVSGGLDWQDIALLGALSEELAEEKQRREQLLREMEKRKKPGPKDLSLPSCPCRP